MKQQERYLKIILCNDRELAKERGETVRHNGKQIGQSKWGNISQKIFICY